MRIADREIGPGHPVFIVVEVGATHGGKLDRALALIDAAADGGANAVKFIISDPATIKPERRDVLYTYQDVHGTQTRPLVDLLAELVFSDDDWTAIRDHAHKRGLIFFCTVDHPSGIPLAERLGVPAYKVCAWDIAYLDLIRAVAATGKPVLIDVGTAMHQEVLAAQKIFMGRGVRDRLMLMHAPHPIDGVNWNMWRVFQFFMPDPLTENSEYPAGFSSPSVESWCDFVAIGAGACLIEKRLTLAATDTVGHHHTIALDPRAFKEWVRQVRQAEAALREHPFYGSAAAWAERKKWGGLRA